MGLWCLDEGFAGEEANVFTGDLGREERPSAEEGAGVCLGKGNIIFLHCARVQLLVPGVNITLRDQYIGLFLRKRRLVLKSRLQHLMPLLLVQHI